jgi:serine/threonine-protein kinase
MRVLSPGDVVNGYKIEELLGRGGMSVVYEAVQLSLERRVALKLMSVQRGDEAQFKLRFRREALIQASLAHPRIVTVHDAGEFEGTPYIVMRLIRGSTLKGLIVDGALDPAQLLNLIGQVAEALDAAHAQNLVHRDIKPQNILVRSGEKAYLADFGLTRLLSDARFTSAGQFVGTVQYIAPEQILGLETTGSADIYALACVLFEGLAGSPPFVRGTEVGVLYAHTNDPAPRLTSLRPELSGAIDAVIERGMAKDPAERYATAVELVEAAQAALRIGTRRL